MIDRVIWQHLFCMLFHRKFHCYNGFGFNLCTKCDEGWVVFFKRAKDRELPSLFGKPVAGYTGTLTIPKFSALTTCHRGPEP